MKELRRDVYSREQIGNLSLTQLKEFREQFRGKGRSSRVPSLVPQKRGSALPLSHAQERLWFLDQTGLVGAAYNSQMSLKLDGALDVQALECALTEVIRRHESLRTHFDTIAGTAVQVIETPKSLLLDIRDLSDREDRALEAERICSEEAQRPFNLAHGPLLRACLITLSPLQCILVVTMHHIVTDGWSWGVFHRELDTLYGAFCRGETLELPQLPVQYVDYAIWQREWLRGPVLERQLEYWKKQLAGVPPQLNLPLDRPRSVIESFKGGRVRFELPAQLSAALRALAQREGITLFMLFLAAFDVLLSRWSGEQDIVLGSPIAGRRDPATEGLIGFFVNTLVLRTEVPGDLTFRELLGRVREVTLGAYANQDVPFEVLVKELRPERSLTCQPIFQVMIELEEFPDECRELPGKTWTWAGAEAGTTHFDLTLYVIQDAHGLSGVFEYATDLFEQETIKRMARHFRTLLEGIVANPDCLVIQLPLIDRDERHLLLAGLNATAAAYPREKLVHELFQEQVARTPNAVAVRHNGRVRTYAALNARANQLARYLRELGLGDDELAGVCVERSVDMVVGLLGILKAGAAYLPLDPNYPSERLQYMLKDGAPRVVLTQKNLRQALPPSDATTIELDTDFARIAEYASTDLPRAEGGKAADGLVYAIYTSGSTGHPKGTGMPHRAMANLLEWHRANLPIDPGMRVLQFAALSFDVAFQETFSTLCGGGTLVLLDETVRRDAGALVDLMRREDIERLFVPPMMLQSIAEHFRSTKVAPENLREVITAGEQLRISAEVVELFTSLRHCTLHNHYGPTETHVVTALTLDGDPEKWPSLPTIGKPITNTQIYILDSQSQPTPFGVMGEIFIGGANVARGYLHRPELTAERFVRDNFSTELDARLYKTGDLGRWRTDGTIEYLGRNDDQVKLRGFRIELGEIESQLARHDQVKAAAVVVREDVPGEKRLVAYVTPRGTQSPAVDALRAHLKALLPDHMVPGAFVILRTLPQTPSGKLNRRALPPPDLDAFAVQRYEPPQGHIEEALARIWKTLLRVERVGRHDNFFDLGGHSLLVLRALFEINQSLGSALKVADAYKSPTVRELAACIDGGTIDDRAIDLREEARLADGVIALPGPPLSPARTVLLTGGTGFVGRFLLAQLLSASHATVFCVVRASSSEQASSRLRSTLTKWGLWRSEFESRIVAIAGDLRRPHLGIEGAVWKRLCDSVDAIYHCATSMNHLETYATAKLANVASACELLSLATSGRPKTVNCISTLGVFNPATTNAVRVIDEESPIDVERHWNSRGYVASKWVAERIFLLACERSVPCNIFRLGLVWADSDEGRYDESQREYRLLKSCLLAGIGIQDYRYDVAPIPVDYTARAIVSLAERHSNGRGIFHIASSSSSASGVFERCNEIAGLSLKLLPFHDWICEIRRIHQEGLSLPVVPLIEFAFSMSEDAFREHRARFDSARIRFDSSHTRVALESAGLVEPRFDDGALRLCVANMLSQDDELRPTVSTRFA